jgi:3-deoxy-manno-octulosonate cytidylyltransferase (CMP-KDO synthetase)
MLSRPELEGVVAVIPARFASSRFPGKPLAPILGVPLVVRVFRRVAQAIPAGQVVVATDDDRIAGVCRAEGISVAMTPSSCVTGTDRVHAAVRGLRAEIIVNVQGDEPMVDPDAIRRVVRVKRENPDLIVNAMCRLTDPADIASPNVPKVVCRANGRLAYMSRAAIPFTKRAGQVAEHHRQVCIYAFDRSQLDAFAAQGAQSRLEAPEDIEILRFLDLGFDVQMVCVSGTSLAVDVPEDVARVEAALAAAGDR